MSTSLRDNADQVGRFHAFQISASVHYEGVSITIIIDSVLVFLYTAL